MAKAIKKKTALMLMWLLPLVFMFAGLSFDRAKYSNDPEYIYITNALNISKLKAVGHFDNPGTTVMQLALVVEFFTHRFDSTATQGMGEEVLKNPDKYVEALNSVLIILVGLTMVFVGYLVYKRTKSLWVGLLVQITPFTSTNMLEHAWTKTSPEPVLLIVSLLLSGLFISYYTDEIKDKRPYSLLFGLISGFALATKASFLPLAVIPFIFLPGAKRKANYIVAICIGFLLFTIPAWPVLPNMFKWLFDLLTHTGVYGQGEKGFIDLPVYLSSLRGIFINNLVYTFILTAAAAVLVSVRLIPRYREHSRTLQYKMLFAIFAAHLLAILIVAKHYHHNHYLLPGMALGGATVYFTILNLSKALSSRLIERTGVVSFILLLSIYILFFSIPSLKEANRGYKITNAEFEETYNTIDEKFADYKLAYYFPTSLNKYSALRFGNAYSHEETLAEMKAIYPDVLFYNKLTASFDNWGNPLSLNQVMQAFGHKLLLVGGPMTEPEANEIVNTGIPLSPIYLGRVQAVYRIETTPRRVDTLQREGITALEVTCDMETQSFDKQYVMSGSNSFIAGATHSREKARSGRFSVKLDQQNIYALEHILSGAKPGDQYLISIWRYSANNEGHLVAASTPANMMYLQTGEFVSTDADGWKLLTLSFTIPENLGENQVKIYVWNSGSTIMYFDDLLIERL